MKQVDEIRETARIAKSFLSDNRPPYAILIALEDIPRLCDALEWAIKHLKNFEGHCDHHALRKIEEILEGK